MSLKNLLNVFAPENKYKGLIIGEVVDNVDPLKIGRVKISIPHLTEGIPPDALPWSHQMFPVGTGTKGGIPTFKVPAIGTQVIVLFPTEDIYSSFYIGELLYKDHDLAELTADYPETYGFIDKIKNKYWVNMKQGTVDLHHHSGTHVNIEKNGTINVTGVNHLNINITNDTTVTIGGNATVDVGGNCAVTVGGNTTVDSGGPITATAPTINLN